VPHLRYGNICHVYTDSDWVCWISFLKIGSVMKRRCLYYGVRNHLPVPIFMAVFTTKRGWGMYAGLSPTEYCGVFNYKAPWQRKSWNFLFEKLLQIVEQVFSEMCSVDPQGLVGFYKGITASYFGISETVVHFVIYEAIKAKLMAYRAGQPTDSKSSRDFLEFMMAGAVSKTIASCIAYPHGKCRRRPY
jgi:hypothetical protein